MKHSFIHFFLFFILTSCGTSTVYFHKVKAPKYLLKGYESVAINPIRNDPYNEFTESLIYTLTRNPRFEILDRTNMGNLITEKIIGKMKNSKEPNYKKGHLILSGEVYQQLKTMQYTEVNAYKGSDGKYHDVTGVGYKGRLRGNIKLTDSNTSKIVLSHNLLTDEYFNKEREEVLYRNRTDAVKEFAELILPYAKQYNHALKKHDEVPELEEGHRLLSDKNFSQAIKKYDKALSNSKVTSEIKADIYHSIAIAHMINNNFKESKKYINKSIETFKNEDHEEAKSLISEIENSDLRMQELM